MKHTQIPVLLCGLICGWKYGLAVGAVLPLTRSLLFGMPTLYPTAIAMTFELATYGLIVGLMYGVSRWKCVKALYISLLTAMVAGRVVWGIAQALLLGLGENGFTVHAFISGAVLTAFPGIILQLTLIPLVCSCWIKRIWFPSAGTRMLTATRADHMRSSHKPVKNAG